MQDTAGAPLTGADPSAPEPAPVPTGGRRRLTTTLVVLAALTLALDQGTKAWALATLTPGEPVDLVGSWIQLNLIRNPGAAFSLGAVYFAGLAVIAGFLWYENSIVRPGDLSRLDAAFFTMNGCVSILAFAATLAAVVLRA